MSSNMPVRLDLKQLDGRMADNEVHVWHADLTREEAAIAQLSQLLDAEEQSRALRFLVSRARIQFVLSRAFLRTTLGCYLGIQPSKVSFRATSHGKPELAGSENLTFNLSHTEGATAIALTRRHRVGVDVERIRENLDPIELGNRFFSPQEAEWLRSQPPEERFPAFFACWTAKEAYVKACGGGLSIPLAGFGIKPGQGNAKLDLDIYGDPAGSRSWSLWQLDLGPALRCAVAVEAPDCTVRLGQWSSLSGQ